MSNQDTSSTDAELREKLLEYSERHQGFNNNTNLTHDQARELIFGKDVDELMELFKQYGIQERIDLILEVNQRIAGGEDVSLSQVLSELTTHLNQLEKGSE